MTKEEGSELGLVNKQSYVSRPPDQEVIKDYLPCIRASAVPPTR
jgi:hypothetical protein